MAFWDDVTGKDPKRAFRWVLEVSDIPAWFLSKVTKPSFTISDVGHKYLNHTYYFPGKVEWDKVSCTLVDPADPDAAGIVMGIISASGYQPPKDKDSLKTVEKRGATGALGQVKIKQIDGDGDDIEVWELHGAWISSAKFGELSYEEDGLTNIEIELRYDYAYVTVNQNVTIHGGSISVVDAKTFPLGK